MIFPEHRFKTNPTQTTDQKKLTRKILARQSDELRILLHTVYSLYLDLAGDGNAGTPDLLRVGELMPDETSNGDGRQAHVGNNIIETGQSKPRRAIR